LDQTYQDFELIILDDCSTDNSHEIIETYKNNAKVSKIIYNDANSGSPFKQWLKGINESAGQYIWIAESDDVASILFLEKTMYLIEKYNAAVVYTASIYIDENGIEIPRQEENPVVYTTKEYYFTGKEFVKNHLTKGTDICNASAVLFRKDAVCDVEDIKKFRLCGDWLFWIKLIWNTSVVYYDEKLNYFRQHTNKVSPNAFRKGLQYLEGLEIVSFLMEQLRFSLFELFSLGEYYLYRIKHDAFIENNDIRSQCLEKWKYVFPHTKSLSFIYFSLLTIDIIIQRMHWFVFRLKKTGFVKTVKYYTNKYILRHNGDNKLYL
jgi:glycosyltransferase involved in cell wall biosynthesis